MRLIEAEGLQKNIARHRTTAMSGAHEETEERMKGYNPSSFLTGFDYGMEVAQKLIGNTPTIEAVPVVHGEWIECDWVKYDGHSECVHYPKEAVKCSNCNNAFKKELLWKDNFCPNCGADMRGGEND